MKKTMLSLLIVCMTTLSMAVNPEYYKTMGETLSGYKTCKSVDDFQTLANKFGMIANAEKGEWLPLYYQAHCFVLMSFMEQADVVKKDEYLDAADKSIEKMMKLVPNESEAYTLQGFCYIARLVVNPMERGQKYSQLSGQALGKALAINPANPRAKVLKLQNDMGAAQFFGKDPSEYCGQAVELLSKWDDYKLVSPIHPAWGKDQAQKIVDGCKTGK